MGNRRVKIVIIFFLIFLFAIVIKLFFLQALHGQWYRELALGIRETSSRIEPKRGEVFMQNIKKPSLFVPLILNEDVYLLYANGRDIKNVSETVENLTLILLLTDEEKDAITQKLTHIGSDPYEPLLTGISEHKATKLREAMPDGIGLVRSPRRFYTESARLGHVTGFYAAREDLKKGQYGIEGYFDGLLSGVRGTFAGERDPFGLWIPFSEKKSLPAIDGADVVLTIDQKIQLETCKALHEGVIEYKAASATALVMNPKTGALLAMCNEPTFDPNTYSQSPSISVYNNGAIFQAYEPGSVFKPITIAAALDAEKISPGTFFEDKGFAQIDNFTIKNAGEKVYGMVTIKDVLIKSINTGSIFAAQTLGIRVFREYVERFGFGVVSGVELDTEVAGSIENLDRNGAIYLATASFGQGISVTPLQMISAFGVIANNGKLIKPQIVKEVHYPNGTVQVRRIQEIRQVIGTRTAATLSRMLTTVVDEGHAKHAAVKGYFIAGKTGTAEIANPEGGYLEEYNHTFVGFGPSDDAQFVVLIKYERPNKRFADETTVHTFAKIAKFLVGYLTIPPER